MTEKPRNLNEDVGAEFSVGPSNREEKEAANRFEQLFSEFLVLGSGVYERMSDGSLRRVDQPNCPGSSDRST